MSKFIIVVLVLFISSICGNIIAQDMPFSKGINLTNWFQSPSAHSIQFSKYSKQDLINIKKLGCDVIRLPINIHEMTSGEPDYIIDNLLFEYLDEVVDWAEEVEINLILDNHSFDPDVNTSNTIGNTLIPVWTQFAEKYKNRSNLIFYEILNEPHGINDLIWNTIQQTVIKAIRKIDSTHTIVVGPAEWNSFHNLKNMPVYSDTNLIYTFHFYDPFLFTHQGASWTDPSLVELKNVPFPYNQSKMPSLPNSLLGTWVGENFNNYINDGSVQKVKELIDIASSFKQTRNVRIFCGEFGVYMPNSDNDDRTYWYEIVREYFEEKQIAWTIWDYQGGFGLFEKGSNELFDYDLNIPLVLALGLNEVEQKEFGITADSIGFPIYDESISVGLVDESYISEGTLNYRNSTDPADGSYSIEWSNAAQYNTIGLNFIPDRDFRYLVNNNMSLRFFIKGDSPETIFDIRFIDTINDIPEDHPWRMRVTIDSSLVEFDNNWHLVDISLNEFVEQGSWHNNAWFDPVGEFDWGAIDKLEIVAEQSNLSGKNIWFDKIEIVDPNTVSVKSKEIVDNFKLDQNYPNPFNPSTTIKYSIAVVEANIASTTNVQLKIYDVLGKEVESLVNNQQGPGNYKIEFDASNLSSGIYYYRLKSENYIETKKMILLK